MDEITKKKCIDDMWSIMDEMPLTLLEFARIIDLSSTTLYHIKAGRRRCSHKTMVKIKRFVDERKNHEKRDV